MYESPCFHQQHQLARLHAHESRMDAPGTSSNALALAVQQQTIHTKITYELRCVAFACKVWPPQDGMKGCMDDRKQHRTHHTQTPETWDPAFIAHTASHSHFPHADSTGCVRFRCRRSRVTRNNGTRIPHLPLLQQAQVKYNHPLAAGQTATSIRSFALECGSHGSSIPI